MQQRLPMIFFTFLLNQEHGVNNERSQSIQSVSHSKRTHRMWPRQKDFSTRRKKEEKSVSSAQRHLAAQHSIGPCLKVWCCHRPALFESRLHSEVMDLYMSVVRVWNDVLLQGLHSSGLSPLLFPEIVYSSCDALRLTGPYNRKTNSFWFLFILIASVCETRSIFPNLFL